MLLIIKPQLTQDINMLVTQNSTYFRISLQVEKFQTFQLSDIRLANIDSMNKISLTNNRQQNFLFKITNKLSKLYYFYINNQS